MQCYVSGGDIEIKKGFNSLNGKAEGKRRSTWQITSYLLMETYITLHYIL
jgi:hypothetical protein